MRSISSIFVLFSVFIFLAACSGTSNKETGEQIDTTKPYLSDASKNEVCLGNNPYKAMFYGATGAQVDIYVSELTAEVVHRNASFNCCLFNIKKTLEFDALAKIIRLYETDVQGMVACSCDCTFAPAWKVHVPATDTYKLEVYYRTTKNETSLIYEGSLVFDGQAGSTRPDSPKEGKPMSGLTVPTDYKPDWPSKINHYDWTDITNVMGVLELLSMQDAARKNSGNLTFYTSSDGRELEVDRGRILSYSRDDVNPYPLGIMSESDLQAMIADSENIAQQYIKTLSGINHMFLGYTIKNEGEEGTVTENTGKSIWYISLSYVPIIEGYLDLYNSSRFSFDKNGLRGFELNTPASVSKSGETKALSKETVKAMLKDDAGVETSPDGSYLFYQRRYDYDGNKTPYTLLYIIKNNSTGGSYMINIDAEGE